MSCSDAVPNIWLRSFFSFSPKEDGYIGWTKEANRKHVIDKIAPGDLMMIYGAGSGSTASSDILRGLGFLKVDPTPIHDIDKASPRGLERKRQNGWLDKWTFALPVRRAWRVTQTARLDQVASETYQPEKGRAIAAWSTQVSEADWQRALDLRVTEVPVFGEPPLVGGVIDRPLRDAFRQTGDDPLLPIDFASAFRRFQSLLTAFDAPFTRFDEGLIAAWDRYKPRVRAEALPRLGADSWTQDQVGSGAILGKVIDARWRRSSRSASRRARQPVPPSSSRGCPVRGFSRTDGVQPLTSTASNDCRASCGGPMRQGNRATASRYDL